MLRTNVSAAGEEGEADVVVVAGGDEGVVAAGAEELVALPLLDLVDAADEVPDAHEVGVAGGAYVLDQARIRVAADLFQRLVLFGRDGAGEGGGGGGRW